MDKEFANFDEFEPEMIMKKISAEQYSLTSIGGIFLFVFILLIIAIIRLKFYL
jgi:hypothetical protein